MTQSTTDLTPQADAVRAEERTAIQRLARAVAAEAARANGYREQAEVSVNFVDFILNQAFAARDAELERMKGLPPSAPPDSGGAAAASPS